MFPSKRDLLNHQTQTEPLGGCAKLGHETQSQIWYYVGGCGEDRRRRPRWGEGRVAAGVNGGEMGRGVRRLSAVGADADLLAGPDMGDVKNVLQVCDQRAEVGIRQGRPRLKTPPPARAPWTPFIWA